MWIWLPLTGLAAAPQSSPLRSEHELLHESGSGAATKKEPQKRFLLVASVKKDNFTTFCADSNYSPLATPDRACACGAKLSASLRARTSAREQVRSSQKKNRKSGSFTLLFNIHNLPLTGLAPAAQSSPLSLRARTSFLLNC